MDRSQKQELVSHVREELQQSKIVVVARQQGLSVAEVTNLRRQMREVGAKFKVLKNTLVRIAVKGTPLEGITDLLSGPTAIAFSSDPVSAAKVVAKFADKNEKLALVGGYMDGEVLSQNSLKYIATLPSLDELRARILGMVMTPATRLAVVSKEPAAKIARVMNAKSAL